ncbi:hypothetical protein [Aurantiacibacter sediminis]|uniref:Uncharacterized protein n=1 Tax=Aurantiacibacter sediminis TaxID=2793064 RepID=A0ABS0N3P7_9SPHN|nr:hypothetical protein [Aurantiacibacter sediminis]MBH5322606.1 hypothetical protein [Aurantiacibacter sediminis]
MTQQIILIGLHPDVVDWDKWPDLSPEKLMEGTEKTRTALEEAGYGVTIGLIKTRDEGAAEAATLLSQKPYALALIGAGVRKDDDQFLLFEKLINLIREHAPQAKVAFNSSPSDTVDAVERWL